MEKFLWVEKYRPTTVDECILPSNLKQTFKEFVKQKTLPNMILSGGAGVGKTTVAKAMINEIGATSMMINGSEESGIDVLRTKIKNFASTSSLEGGRKYLILDESDYLNPQSTQPALRGFMEEFHKNCGFILTCNYKNRLIEPLHSRCSGVDFKISDLSNMEINNEKYDCIVANIQADILQLYCDQINLLAKDNSVIILSGILSKEIDEVIDTFLNKNSSRLKNYILKTGGEWSSVLFSRF